MATRHIRQFVALCAAAAAALLSTGHVQAACQISGNTTTCSGNVYPFSDLRQGGSDQFTYIFEDLNADPTNGASAEVINIQSIGDAGSDATDKVGVSGAPLAVTFDGGDFDLSSTANGVNLITQGGAGKDGKNHGGSLAGGNKSGGDGGTGGTGGDLSLTWTSGDVDAVGFGIRQQSLGGVGGGGGRAATTSGKARGGKGAAGGAGGAVTFDLGGDATIVLSDPSTTGDGLAAYSLGGDGGDGGNASGTFGSSNAGDGGNGGVGGDVIIKTTGGLISVATVADQSDAVHALSLGGNGGHGGNGTTDVGTKGKGGNGGIGGDGGVVTVDLKTALSGIVTSGDQSQGVFARSYGGSGGDGGKGKGGLAAGKGGAAKGPGNGGAVSVTITGMIATSGGEANAILVQSIGGFAGDAGSSSGFVAYGADSESGGLGGDVAVTLGGGTTIMTSGSTSAGVLAQSVGGGGGRGSSGDGIVALGGTGSAGGAGGAVTVTSNGDLISTGGATADAIQAMSVGGSGGSAGASNGIVSLGGEAGSGGPGGAVTVTNIANLTTIGDQADGLFAQSVGGGGGKAHSTGGIVALGGSGGDGGTGGTVDVTLGADAVVTTQGDDADAIYLQSVGGGGGSGSSALGAGVEFSMAYGGSGGSGGDGGNVTFTNGGADAVALGFGKIDYTIVTEGDRARGVLAQSIGGGGGDGGNAISASAGLAVDVALGASGGGATAGSGGTVMVTVGDNIMTSGNNAAGIFAQSAGGGGGSAGNTISSANGYSISAGVALGGTGGSGGAGGAVSVVANGAVATAGKSSSAVVAQSVGGGGGHSGVTMSGNAIDLAGASIALGGDGGNAGNAGKVEVEANGPLTTGGAGSDAVLAQSIGGSGGAANTVIAATGVGGTASADIGIGASGGSGGNGGIVYVTVADTIATGGDNSYGITAQSIGGGGGNGSITIAGSFAAMGDANIAVGGDGGGSGTGGDVTVSAGGITTSGYNSVGILAQSISNAGGNGGFTIDGSGISGGNVGVAVAGSGGSGGSSGDVKVSVGSVTTAGNAATGVKAMSVAGGGGSAVGGISGTMASMGEVGVTIGGSGGSGGKAGTVKITASGVIKTTGDSADGIFALSQGGSGGNGGFAIEGSLTAGEYSGTANVTIGGGGGDGGSGGAVTVDNAAADGSSPSISVAGYASRGIAAQSIGGSGGNGGSVYSGNLTISFTAGIQLGVNVGGAGGKGAVGGGVTVTNDGAIETGGIYGDAIFAQSIGGDGGNGGSSYSVSIQATTSSSATIQTSIGGAGGSGNNGGKVEVANAAALTTTAKGAAAIYSQSVGGGGGRGGNAASLMFDFTNPPTEGTTVQFNADAVVGGSGGAGGDGGAVTVMNSGVIGTKGRTSWGIYAQSVGGGGGDGGSVSSQVITVNGQCIVSSTFGFNCTSPGGIQTIYEPSLQIAVGGQGGAGGNGGTVTVDNREAITTEGYDATAIFAQSVGGGGGTGGYSNIGIAPWAPNAIIADINEIIGLSRQVANLTSYQNLRVVIGGQGGAAGDGGDVSVKNSAAIHTTGNSTYAVFAQSVGGGGGNGGNALGSFGTLISANVGGAGSGGGNGGAVSVTSSGPISTTGKGSVAIFAQSVGGGGGSAGDIEAALNHSWADLNIGISTGIQLAAGKGGNGGDVTIKLSDDGTITTTGKNAHGIFAQSVGGTGGAAHLNSAGGGIFVFAGSAGDAGKGGDITITTSGTAINVSGVGAEGIFAQSVSGTKSTSSLVSTAGNIYVDVTADVIASGENGRAMLLQSQGFEGNGQITVKVGKNATVSTAMNGHEAIGFLDGLNNTLTNAGTIEKPEGGSLTGNVVRAEGGQLAITNNGTLNGSIRLDASYANSLANNRNLGLGLRVDLGKKSTLQNDGTMSAGTIGTIGNSTITGALTQSSGGIIYVDFAFAGGNDLITTTSDSAAPELAGIVVPAPLFQTLPRNGVTGSFVILAAESGIAANSLTVDSTAAINYVLSQKATSGAGQEVVLSYDVHYTPWNARSPPSGLDITRNHTNFGHYVNDLVKVRRRDIASGTNKLAFVDDLTRYILSIQDVADLVDVYDRFAPATLFAPADAALFSSFGFADSLNSCPDQSASGTAVFTRDGSCIWAELGGTASRGDTHGGSIGFDEDAFNAAGGIQSEFVDGVFAGFAFDYQTTKLWNDVFSGNGDRFQFGGSLKKQWGNSTLSASLSGGFGNYDLTHQIFTPGGAETAHSSPDTNWLAAHARFSHVFDVTDNAYVKPWIDVGVDHQWQGAFKSKTGDPYGIDVGATDATFVSVNPMVEVGGVLDVMGMTTEANIRAGALAIVSGNGWSAKARLHGAGGAGPTYTISDDVDTLFAQVGASIKTRVNRNVTLELGFDGLFSTHQQQYAGTARLNVNF